MNATQDVRNQLTAPIEGNLLCILRPQEKFQDGYTLLYAALQQESERDFHMILERSTDKSPIVHVPLKSTALHIACRFAYKSMVTYLLDAGASANVLDDRGCTPLHEALKHMNADRDNDPTPRELAKSHPIQAVRDMFDAAVPERVPRPPRLHARKPSEHTTRTTESQAHSTTKPRVYKNPKSLVGNSVYPIPPNVSPGQIQEVNRTSKAQDPTKNNTVIKEEASPLTVLPSPWIGEDISKKVFSSRSPQREDKISRHEAQRSYQIENPYPSLSKDYDTPLIDGKSSAAALFWGNLHRLPAESHVQSELKQEKQKRGRARWKPVVL
ncbi:hypothetical protein F5B22DRAFT_656942 [Xylaria bambusicola]|uniref:uncharacterized protein n=1 Tax=Xylaria bambusicola TaxID=326684 RepID=UPI0020089ECE|nr:uncharacterized protein F5B22DRAFT_656942 [Xylaria bambusicola]KAI0513226.1 hypothetical protein F5B22DRAFT_656942 [Xylaria bambusicola]